MFILPDSDLTLFSSFGLHRLFFFPHLDRQCVSFFPQLDRQSFSFTRFGSPMLFFFLIWIAHAFLFTRFGFNTFFIFLDLTKQENYYKKSASIPNITTRELVTRNNKIISQCVSRLTTGLSYETRSMAYGVYIGTLLKTWHDLN